MVRQPKVLRPRLALLAGMSSLVTVAIMIVIKIFAYSQSGGASMLASLVDSVTDASASIMTFFAIRLSLKPADADHRYGHGKAEGLAALVQAAFIGGAGLFLIFESVARFSHPHDMVADRVVIAVMAVSTLLSLLLIGIQKYSLRYAPSLAVEADQAHYKSDIFVNLGVLAVTLALRNGAPHWIDPVFALIVALWLGLTVRNVAGKGIDMLLDRELPGDVRETITRKVLTHRQVMGLHDLRTNKAGMMIFISFDIEVEPSLSLRDAHEITRELEQELLRDYPLAEIMIHVDPYGDTDDSRHRVAGLHH